MNKFSVKWIYVLEIPVMYRSGKKFSENYFFYDLRIKKKLKRKLRMVITKEGKIFVLPHYSWDGCTPKFCMFDLYVGTPDGAIHLQTLKPKTYYASLFHDALYQFLQKDGPYTRKDADNIFFDLMKFYEFAPRCIYWGAVRVFGGFVRSILRRKRKHTGKMELVPSDNKELQRIINEPHEVLN